MSIAMRSPSRTSPMTPPSAAAGGLHDAAILGKVAGEHSEPAVPAVCVGRIADHPARAIKVELLEAPLLAERDRGRHAAGRRAIEGSYPLARGALDVPAVER